MTDKMREEFESWAPVKHSHFLYPFNRVDGTDRYVHSEVQQDWAVWKASRKSLAIELPSHANGTTADLPGFDGQNDYLLREPMVIAAIEAAGVRVKE